MADSIHKQLAAENSAAGFDVVKKPKHYNSHPSGVECRTITGYLTGNVASAWKYVWRLGLKWEDREDLDKAINYLEEEQRRRKGLASYSMDVFVPDKLEKRVRQVLTHESGARQQFFASLWAAHILPSGTKHLADAARFAEVLKAEIKRN